jgi:hypothetical protein
MGSEVRWIDELLAGRNDVLEHAFHGPTSGGIILFGDRDIEALDQLSDFCGLGSDRHGNLQD